MLENAAALNEKAKSLYNEVFAKLPAEKESFRANLAELRKLGEQIEDELKTNESVSKFDMLTQVKLKSTVHNAMQDLEIVQFVLDASRGK